MILMGTVVESWPGSLTGMCRSQDQVWAIRLGYFTQAHRRAKHRDRLGRARLQPPVARLGLGSRPNQATASYGKY